MLVETISTKGNFRDFPRYLPDNKIFDSILTIVRIRPGLLCAEITYVTFQFVTSHLYSPKISVVAQTVKRLPTMWETRV